VNEDAERTIGRRIQELQVGATVTIVEVRKTSDRTRGKLSTGGWISMFNPSIPSDDWVRRFKKGDRVRSKEYGDGTVIEQLHLISVFIGDLRVNYDDGQTRLVCAFLQELIGVWKKKGHVDLPEGWEDVYDAARVQTEFDAYQRAFVQANYDCNCGGRCSHNTRADSSPASPPSPSNPSPCSSPCCNSGMIHSSP